MSVCCTDARVRRFGRTDNTGQAIAEKRCTGCGRTLNTGGSK